jgi:hypothetical protein
MHAWQDHVRREEARYRDGEARLEHDDPDARQRQLTRIGNAAYGAALSFLMVGDRDRAAEWFGRAAARYRESLEDAPPESWGRYIGALKARLPAGDGAGAVDEARAALAAGAATSPSPIGRYAAALAHLALGDDHEARQLANGIRIRDDFPRTVGDALAMIAAGSDRVGYVAAVEDVLASFEARDDHLEDVPVADTVLVLQALAAERGFAAELESPLLPPDPSRQSGYKEA